MSPNREKHKQQYGKPRPISPLSNDYAWRERLEDFEYQFKPMPVQDPEVSSILYGPFMKVVQWDKTVRRGD